MDDRLMMSSVPVTDKGLTYVCRLDSVEGCLGLLQGRSGCLQFLLGQRLVLSNVVHQGLSLVPHLLHFFFDCFCFLCTPRYFFQDLPETQSTVLVLLTTETIQSKMNVKQIPSIQ